MEIIPVDEKKIYKKQVWIFYLGMFATALLMILMIVIDEKFIETLKYFMELCPGFKNYYLSLSKFDQSTILDMIYTTTSMGLPALIGILLFFTKPSKMLPIKKVDAGVFSAIVLFGLGISTVSNLATGIISSYVEIAGLSTKYTDSGMGSTVPETLLRIIAIAVFPAFFEEILFRGVILQSLRKYSCDSFAIIFSAFLFGLAHGNIVQMPFAFLGGIYFAFVTVKTSSLLPSMAVHFVNNFLSCMLTLIFDWVTYKSAAFFIYRAVEFVLIFIGIIMIVRLSKKDDELIYVEPNKKLFPEKKMWLFAITNIAVLAGIVYYCKSAVELMFR